MMDIEKPNCIGCHHIHPDNGNCTAVGGFCTAVPAAKCPLIPELRVLRLTPPLLSPHSRPKTRSCGAKRKVCALIGISLLQKLPGRGMKCKGDKEGL